MDVDLISFDPDDIGLVKCNRKMYNLAVERGLSFEIMYTPAIRDSTARKNIIQLAHFYHAFGKSKVRLWLFVLLSFMKLLKFMSLVKVKYTSGLASDVIKFCETEVIIMS